MATNRLAKSEEPERRKLTPQEIVEQGNRIIRERVSDRTDEIEWVLRDGKPVLQWKKIEPKLVAWQRRADLA
jgi:hypothetical protein